MPPAQAVVSDWALDAICHPLRRCLPFILHHPPPEQSNKTRLSKIFAGLATERFGPTLFGSIASGGRLSKPRSTCKDRLWNTEGAVASS